MHRVPRVEGERPARIFQNSENLEEGFEENSHLASTEKCHEEPIWACSPQCKSYAIDASHLSGSTRNPGQYSGALKSKSFMYLSRAVDGPSSVVRRKRVEVRISLATVHSPAS